MMKVARRLAILALSCAAASAAQGLATRITADEFRSRFNLACQSRGITLRLGDWKPGRPGTPDLTADVTPTTRVIGERDGEGRLASVLLIMESRATLESVAAIVATLAATTYAANPELSNDEREALFDQLGFHQDGWGARGLDGIATRRGVTYRVIHQGGDPLIVALVTWDAPAAPAQQFSF